MSNRQGATIKLYDNDSHEKEFTALVRSCVSSGDFFKVELDRTAFFPEGGGQYADTGVLVVGEGADGGIEIEVTDVQIEDKVIYHFVKTAIAEGTQVVGKLNWDERFLRMQNHTGEHIISGLIHSTFGYENIGFHLGDDDVTCDYNGALNWEQIKMIEAAANAAVFRNIEIKTEYPDPEKLPELQYRSKLDLTEDVRLVTIPGVDCCACCAPHVKYTGEVGLIKIVNHEKSHGGTRLHIRCGFLALADYDEKQDNILRIVDLLSARQYETADCVEQLMATNGKLTHELAKASKAIAEAKLSALDVVEGNLVVCLEHADTDALRALANGGKDKCTGVFVALTETDGGYRYMITGNGIPLSKLSKEFNALLVGRGGGKDDMLQGVFASALPVIEDFFENWSYSE